MPRPYAYHGDIIFPQLPNQLRLTNDRLPLGKPEAQILPEWAIAKMTKLGCDR